MCKMKIHLFETSPKYGFAGTGADRCGPQENNFLRGSDCSLRAGSHHIRVRILPRGHVGFELGYAAGRFGSSKLRHSAHDLSDPGMTWRGEWNSQRVLSPPVRERFRTIPRGGHMTSFFPSPPLSQKKPKQRKKACGTGTSWHFQNVTFSPCYVLKNRGSPCGTGVVVTLFRFETANPGRGRKSDGKSRSETVGRHRSAVPAGAADAVPIDHRRTTLGCR